MILDGDGQPLVFYYAELVDDSKGLRFARKVDGEWQAEWIEQFYKVALGRPLVSTVTYGQLVDGPDAGGLVNEDFSLKKAYHSIGKFQKMILKTSIPSK